MHHLVSDGELLNFLNELRGVDIQSFAKKTVRVMIGGSVSDPAYVYFTFYKSLNPKGLRITFDNRVTEKALNMIVRAMVEENSRFHGVVQDAWHGLTRKKQVNVNGTEFTFTGSEIFFDWISANYFWNTLIEAIRNLGIRNPSLEQKKDIVTDEEEVNLKKIGKMIQLSLDYL